MKKIAALVIATAMVVPVVTGCGAVVVPTESTGETTVKELAPARAQDDYFRFINQGRFDEAEFEYGSQASGSSFDIKLVDEQVEGIIKDVAKGSGYKKGSEEDIIKTAYDSFLAYDFKNEPIPEDLMAMIDAADNCKTVDELLKVDAKLVRDYGMEGFFRAAPNVDPFDPQNRVLAFNPYASVLSTSFLDLKESLFAADSVMSDAKVVLATRGYDKETAEKTGKALAYLTIDLYEATDMELAEAQFDYEYTKILKPAEAKALLSNVDLDSYFKEIGFDVSKIKNYALTDEGQLKALNAMMVDENIDALKTWEIANIYNKYQRYIAPHYSQLAGMIKKNYDSIEKQVVDEVQAAFPEETDPIYVERYYTAEMDKKLRDMCDDIKDGYRKLIANATWLSEPTRKELLKKLENIVYVTGSTLERHNNSEYQNIAGKNYYELYINYQRLNTQKQIKKLGEPVSRTDILMEMQVLNACYNPSFNNITITVAIMNDPFFSVDADYYTNLGGLGMVIAHEMGHAFDSNCIVFNSKGEYKPDWIPAEDRATLKARNEKAVRYFEDNFKVFGIYHVDGEQTLGENYADLGAMECIASLAKTKEDRLKLFENYATIWSEMRTDDAIINQVADDVHSPSVIRVNAVLSTVEAFYETYDVKDGDGMYIAPEKRISRWY